MEVKKEDIIRLRRASGQSIMDCKQALVEKKSFGKAFDHLRTKAKEKIDHRRKDKVASEGKILIKGKYLKDKSGLFFSKVNHNRYTGKIIYFTHFIFYISFIRIFYVLR